MVAVVSHGDYFKLSVALIIRGVLLVVVLSLRLERNLHVLGIKFLLKLVLLVAFIHKADVLGQVEATHFCKLISRPTSIFF